MRTSAEIALRKPRSQEEYQEALLQILQESERLSQLIEQLLILARSDSGSAVVPMTRTDIKEPLRHACQQASIFAEKKHLAISERLPEKPLWVQGDRSSLERLFLILLDNAMKYTEDGGSIQVRLNAQDGFAIAAIEDSGVGIAKDDISHIFERFYRADVARSRDIGGIGLGLAIGNWIAQVHSGEIRVESELAKGSCFEVRLPLIQ
jgi:signal transduction histidine kinase